MTDTAAPQKCAACGGELPARKKGGMKVVNPRIGFTGYFCEREACREAGFAKAMDDGEER